jgi:hypothetical protein
VCGYPLDERSDEQRARDQSGILGDVELTAARVVARLTGETVTLQDDNSAAGMPDLRIDHADGRVAYGEVTTDIDKRYAAMTSLLRKKDGRLPRELVAPGLRRVWFVGLTGRANLKRLDQGLPPLLRALEDDGVTLDVIAAGDRLAAADHAGLRQLHDLGIADVTSREPRVVDGKGEPPRVVMFAAGTAGPAQVDEAAFVGWVDDVLVSDPLRSKRAKLARTGADERHLFLGASYTTPWAAFLMLTAEQVVVPDRAPALPPEITHLWLMNFQAPGRCLVWYPELGWRDAQRHWATG